VSVKIFRELRELREGETWTTRDGDTWTAPLAGTYEIYYGPMKDPLSGCEVIGWSVTPVGPLKEKSA
jgi:hypothetical protein